MYESKTEDLLCSHRLPDFEITSLSGEICLLSDVINNTESDKENTVLAFLEAGQEPTEHVLNEMLSQKDLLKNSSCSNTFHTFKQGRYQSFNIKRSIEGITGHPNIF